MNTSALKAFATEARSRLISLVGSRLTYILKEESVEIQSKTIEINSLKEQIAKHSQTHVIETAAYIWFNRLIAIRFMDANGYATPRILSPVEGHTVPEILQQAKSGVIGSDLNIDKARVINLLDGKISHANAQGEAYRMLLVASCNALSKTMPFMFEPIADWTELLLPDDLLSDASIIADIRNGMCIEDCQEEEVIGWLYQFYIAEKKDQVFAGLKKNQKITAENIPAATQLFTPHWIVRYLVENTLGKMWIQLKPTSTLRAHMPYYIEQEPCGDLPVGIRSIKDITFLDPCAGSGHILVYAFELFYKMYEEEGYDPEEIPSLILTHNLFGLEIDDRAAALAGFALCMKSRKVNRHFFKKPVLPNVKAFQNLHFSQDEINRYMARIGIDVFTAELAQNLMALANAKNFGSLIRPTIANVDDVQEVIDKSDVAGDMFLAETHRKVMDGLEMIGSLQRRYACVVTNPPYMGGKGMSDSYKRFLTDNYQAGKSDAFAAFMIRMPELALPNGQLGFVTPYVWMFISSYEDLRKYLLSHQTITSLIQLEYNAFEPACVPVCSFTMVNYFNKTYKGSYIKLSDFKGCENQAPKTLEAITNQNCKWFYRVSAENLGNIPGSPVAYWVSGTILDVFRNTSPLGEVVDARQGLATADNNTFLRLWWEVSLKNVFFNAHDREDAKNSGCRWFPYNKGGNYRKWYGNHEFIVDWKEDGKGLEEFKPRSVIRNPNYYFRPSISWSDVTCAANSFRYYPHGFIFDSTGHSAFPNLDATPEQLLSLLNNKLTNELATALNPTMHFHVGYFNSLPYASLNHNTIKPIISSCIAASEADWNSFEHSWGFAVLPIFAQANITSMIACSYNNVIAQCKAITSETLRLETENNRIFISAYGLESELTPEVPIHEITLTCNPAYRYGPGKTDAEYAALQKTDTMRELLSYLTGCMFGRFSLDKPGLILANAGETLADYITKVFGENVTPPSDALLPDEDAIIPILDDEYFTDDIVNRTKTFLSKAFAPETLSENIAFIEDALDKDLRKFFAKDFYADHIKRYKKRPIYWMFSSPKGAFRALIYMHRYRSDTLSQMLSNYLRPLIDKLKDERVVQNRTLTSETASQADKTRAQKRLDKLIPQIEELQDYEQVLYRLATKRIEIDLDDGVRVNYPKFAPAIVPIKGLESEEE